MSTHFDIFGLEPTVDVDVKALEASYRKKSLELHPDRNPNARVEAAANTASLNEAFKVLKDPIRRAFYLLRLNGVDLERECAGPQGRNLGLPMEFLEQILDQREALDEARQRKDPAAARRMGESIRQQMDRAVATASQALREKQVEVAKEQLAQVRYYQRFLEEVEAIEEAVA
ncbi:MAG: Fe-S protein assembly co-chaperone HscB [Myxococcaceae bacterium]